PRIFSGSRLHSMTNEEQNRFIERIQRLTPERLISLERLLAEWESKDSFPRDWPHAPIHRLSEHGTFLVTAATLYKENHFPTPQRLDLVESKLLELAQQYGWQLEAWAVFSNHYHFVGHSQPASALLNDFLSHLHSVTAKEINEQDGSGS